MEKVVVDKGKQFNTTSLLAHVKYNDSKYEDIIHKGANSNGKTNQN